MDDLSSRSAPIRLWRDQIGGAPCQRLWLIVTTVPREAPANFGSDSFFDTLSAKRVQLRRCLLCPAKIEPVRSRRSFATRRPQQTKGRASRRRSQRCAGRLSGSVGSFGGERTRGGYAPAPAVASAGRGTTCVAVVRHYVERARAYNGVRERPRHHDRLVRRIGRQRGQALGAAAAGVAGLPFLGA
jgi:hypothetical protein